eukprot:234-Pelagococcus_subviridis.AAC.1
MPWREMRVGSPARGPNARARWQIDLPPPATCSELAHRPGTFEVALAVVVSPFPTKGVMPAVRGASPDASARPRERALQRSAARGVRRAANAARMARR